jgi:hypothetical protein
MVRSMLFLHWRQIRAVLALFAVAAFALPLIAVQGLGVPAGSESATLEAYRLVGASQLWLALFPSLALAIGATLGLSSWNWDHQLGHVYALSLPLSRWEYVVNKLAAGALLALVPVAGMWIGAHVAAASISLPAGLNAYPNELAIRFFFAIIVSYALLFAMAAGTIRTTLWITGTALTLLVLGLVANDVLVSSFPVLERVNVVEAVMDWMVGAGGPFEVFTGSWALIDV